jgi:hypothetical protein
MIKWSAAVLDAVDSYALGRFYADLLGWGLRPEGRGDDWYSVLDPGGDVRICIQEVPWMPAPLRGDAMHAPEGGVRTQVTHLDFFVPTLSELEEYAARAEELGATRLFDLATDPDEPLYVYGDPEGHPFCLFVAS